MRPARRFVTALPLAALALAVAACDLTATPGPEASPTAGPTALGSEPPDPHAAILTGALEDLRASAAAAREALAAAGNSSGQAGADAAALAVERLAADEELGEGADAPDPRPLFPGPETSRAETIDYGDAFSATLSAARAAGPTGAQVLDLLRDPVGGDLGSWQRDAAGTLEQIRTTAAGAGDLAAAEVAIAELDGEGPKALAWAYLAADASDDDDRAAFAERGVAHLDLVLDAVDEALAQRQGGEA
ncbi:MAG: hypothetical protein KY461_11445 [Actinobacteria bacterium]|nr:hypothetical protein [Actinomycetota bacterium]